MRTVQFVVAAMLRSDGTCRPTGGDLHSFTSLVTSILATPTCNLRKHFILPECGGFVGHPGGYSRVCVFRGAS